MDTTQQIRFLTGGGGNSGGGWGSSRGGGGAQRRALPAAGSKIRSPLLLL